MTTKVLVIENVSTQKKIYQYKKIRKKKLTIKENC